MIDLRQVAPSRQKITGGTPARKFLFDAAGGATLVCGLVHFSGKPPRE